MVATLLEGQPELNQGRDLVQMPIQDQGRDLDVKAAAKTSYTQVGQKWPKPKKKYTLERHFWSA